MEVQYKGESTGVRRRLTRILMASLAIPAFALVAGAAQAAPVKKHHAKAHHAKHMVAPAELPATKAEAAPVGRHTSLHFDWRAVPAPISGSAYSPDNFMTGDWYGYRTRLHDMGVDMRFDLDTEAGSVVGGGRANGSAFAQQVGAGFSVDTARAFGWQYGGFFNFYMEDRTGSPLDYYSEGSANTVGNGIEPLEIYGHGENFRLSQMWYDQPFLDDKVSLRIGYYPYGNEFGTSRNYYEFVNTVFCAHMQGLPADAKGWDDGPRGAWTARLKLTPTDNFYAMTAITTIQPILTSTTQGWNLGFDNNKGYNIPAEMGYLWGIHNPSDLDGSIKVGGYFDSAHSTLVQLYKKGTAANGSMLPGATLPEYQYGGYLLLEQQVFRTNGTGSQGLRVFGEYLIGDHTSALWKDQFEVGATLKGTFPGRQNDTLTLGVSYVALNNTWLAYESAKLGTKVEANFTTIELNYGIHLTPWLTVKPFLQYQTNPGALTATAKAELYNDSKVIGFETKWNF